MISHWGGATPTFKYVNYYGYGGGGVSPILQCNGIMLPTGPYIRQGEEFDEGYPYDSAGGVCIPGTRHNSSYSYPDFNFPIPNWWTTTQVVLNGHTTHYFQAERVYYSLSSETISDVRDFQTALETYGNIKLFVIDAELFASYNDTIWLSGMDIVGNEPFILNTITFTESQLENFFWKDEHDEFDFDTIIGNKVELPWSPLYNNKYIMLATNAMSFGS